MKKLLIVALLAVLAPLGVVAHAAPKPAPTKAPMHMGGKMSGKKMTHKKKTHKKMTGKKMTGKKTMPMRDPKTGRFMKSSTPKAMATPKK